MGFMLGRRCRRGVDERDAQGHRCRRPHHILGLVGQQVCGAAHGGGNAQGPGQFIVERGAAEGAGARCSRDRAVNGGGAETAARWAEMGDFFR